MKRVVLLAVLALAVAVPTSCASDDEGATGATASAYFLVDDRVWPVQRDVEPDDELRAALEALLEGPDENESSELELETAIPEDTALDGVSVENGVATVSVSSELSDEALAQVVYTATQFEDVESVDMQGETRTRADFEEQTPSILVESPLAFQTVTAPFEVTGTANTFEANFNYEVLDADDEILDENFVTATSGTGTRGTFAFTPELTADDAGDITLVVYEISAEDGSRFREWRIPLELEE